MSEKHEHLSFCRYIKMQYPDIIFFSESSGLRLSVGMAKQLANVRSNDGLPDIFIAKAVRPYNGLFIELKRTGANIYKKNGDLKKDKHLENQAKCIRALYAEGYYATFAEGFDEAVDILNKYLKGKL